MKNKITHNLALKILSVAFAFILWLVVVNINDPDTVKTIRSIDITILNEQAITGQGEGQVYTIKDNRAAAIVVKGPRSIVDNLDKNDVKATVDFSEVSSVGAVPINIVSLPDGVALQSKITENMKIEVEPLLTERFQVEIETTGTPAGGYVVGDTEVSPNVVNIKAPQSVMEKIRRVMIRLDVDGMSTDISGRSVSLVLIDGNGKEIEYAEDEHITLSAVTLLAGAQLLRYRTVPMQFAVSGEVREGYRYTGMQLSAQEVTLKGVRETVDAITTVDIPAEEEAFTLTDLTESRESSVDILPYIPEGTTLLNETERYVTVKLNVEELHTRSLYLPIEQLTVKNLAENLDIAYEVTPDSMVELEGLQEDLAMITAETLHPIIDLKDKKAGSYVCEVAVTVPEGVEKIKSSVITVVLTEKRVEKETETENSDGEETETHREVRETTTQPATTERTTIPVMIKPAETTKEEKETTAPVTQPETSEKSSASETTTQKETT